jgi:hypothetical protein
MVKPVVYPTTVPDPSPEIVQSLFEEAIQSSKNATDDIDKDDIDKNNNNADQDF